MSLTSDLKTTDSFARAFVDLHFPTLGTVSRDCNRSLRSLGVAENPHAHKTVSMLVGTAVDYRVRAYFRRSVHRSHMIQKGLSRLERDRYVSVGKNLNGPLRFRR